VTETRRITYQGSAPILRALVQALEAEGVTVSLRRGVQPTTEERDTRTIVENVVAILIAEGGVAGIKAGVRKFQANFPRAKVEIEGEEDGGPMFRTGRMD
jgi:predicted flavoprotein YhiN